YSVSIDNIPKQLQDAFISIEDERFESHNGIDPRRIAGAIYTDIIKILKGERGFHGASTITQQLLKNTILSNEVRLSRKVTEIYLAIQLEDKLTKNQILEAYLNTIPIGGPTFGVEAAAEYYFNKSITELTLAESAYLAGATQDPTGYNAFMDSNIQDPSRYINRTKTVLGKMLELQKISNEDYNNAIAEIDAGALQATFAQTIEIRQSAKNKLNFEWFTRPVIDQVKKALIDKYKYTEAEAANLLNNGGLKIYSTMSRELQNHTQDVLNNDPTLVSISKPDENGIIQPQASAVIMDYKTGQVKAMVGGRGDQPALSYNRAYDHTHYGRSPGSTLKPITVYAAAIDSKSATTGTVFEDSPLQGSLLSEYGGQVKNSPNVYSGYINMRDAVRRSVNIYAIKMVEKIGKPISAAYAEKFGINMGGEEFLAPLGLGEFKTGTTTYQMAAAYGPFGNSGIYNDPILFTKVEDKNGNVILESSLTQREVLSPQAAFITYDLLKGPLSYTATKAKLGSMPAAGKTGTSSNTKDLWFSGLTPHYSASVWVGKDTYEPKENLEGKFRSNDSASLWSKIMIKANEGLSTADIPMPSGIQRASVCSVSGHLPTELCKKGHAGKTSVVTDYFIKGTVPTTLCDVHVEAEVNSANNKLATENTPAALRVKKIFIKRDYKPSVNLTDQQYVLPTEKDDTVAAPTIPDTEAPPTDNNGGNNGTPGNNGPGNGNGNGTGNNGNDGNTPGNTQPNP
ncbi:MAG: transglycosylase domain-containing protein, partial [Clostridiaceae bacterium]